MASKSPGGKLEEEKLDLSDGRRAMIASSSASTITTTARNGSATKNGLARRLLVSMLSTSAIHVLPLGLSVFLICINSSGRFWFDIDTEIRVQPVLQLSTSNILHLLQLAAKAYELLIILSLSVIVLGTYRRMLASSGLPLGLVTAGYRTGNLSYFGHPGLWTGVKGSPTYMAFGVLVILSTTLSVVAGPACAILMLPTPGWYSFGRSSDISPGSVVFSTPNYTIWPTDTKSLPPMTPEASRYCLGIHALEGDDCPGAGHAELLDWVVEWDSDITKDSNITMKLGGASLTSQVHREIYAFLHSNDSATTLTTLSSVSGAVVAAYYGLVANQSFEFGQTSSGTHDSFRVRTQGEEVNLQPLTQAKCQAFDLDAMKAAGDKDNATVYPYFPMDGIQCLDDSGCTSWQSSDTASRRVHRSHWDYTPKPTNRSFRWVDTPGPLSAVFNFPDYALAKDSDVINPPNAATESRNNQDQRVVQGYYIVACSFVARWVPSTVTAKFLQTDTVQSNLSSSDIFARGGREVARLGFPLQLSKAWADYLDFNTTRPTNGTEPIHWRTIHRSSAINAITGFFTTCWFPRGVAELEDNLVCSPRRRNRRAQGAAQDLERAVGAVLTDGIARIGPGQGRLWKGEQLKPLLVTEQSPDRIDYIQLAYPYTYTGSIIGTITNTTILPRPGNSTHPSVKINHINGRAHAYPSNKTMAEWNALFDSYTEFALAVDRYGFGSGTPSPTLTFATVVVCLYMATVVGYAGVSVAALLCAAAPRVAPPPRAGDDVQDLVALAWRSRCPGVRRRGAGAEGTSTGVDWSEVVAMRVGGNEEVELVVRGADGPGREKEELEDMDR